ncbi:hypothetical protein FA95DRAFT_73925 [Auriscalpium vulgare]|uniref:Uncharacterized protein n=1 Tax=Auriscalpium vulgare TaxID=40419 RepID=A0ACB8RQU5_9AGAM|nr:hypothetical protein FA95DRAFT_73925 [Auriscalpium vulgare]
MGVIISRCAVLLHIGYEPAFLWGIGSTEVSSVNAKGLDRTSYRPALLPTPSKRTTSRQPCLWKFKSHHGMRFSVVTTRNHRPSLRLSAWTPNSASSAALRAVSLDSLSAPSVPAQTWLSSSVHRGCSSNNERLCGVEDAPARPSLCALPSLKCKSNTRRLAALCRCGPACACSVRPLTQFQDQPTIPPIQVPTLSVDNLLLSLDLGIPPRPSRSRFRNPRLVGCSLVPAPPRCHLAIRALHKGEILPQGILEQLVSLRASLKPSRRSRLKNTSCSRRRCST